MKRYLNKFSLLLFYAIGFLLVGMLVSCQEKPEKYHLGILQWTESLEPFELSYNGVIDSLRDKGYRDGINIETT